MERNARFTMGSALAAAESLPIIWKVVILDDFALISDVGIAELLYRQELGLALKAQCRFE